MQRQHDREVEAQQELHEALQARRIVDRARPMRRREHVLACADARLAQRLLVGARARGDDPGDVDHDVADDLDRAGDRFAREVVRRALRGHEQQVADVVGDDAVELLGHRAVERAHPGLDVRDGDPQLRRCERARERRVRVAVDEHRVGLLGAQQIAERGEHARRLLGVRAAAELQLDVRARHRELAHEDRRQLVVVVLARVDEQLLVRLAQDPGHGGRLDELRPVADDREDLHPTTSARARPRCARGRPRRRATSPGRAPAAGRRRRSHAPGGPRVPRSRGTPPWRRRGRRAS